MKNRSLLIFIASLCAVIASLTLANAEYVFAFKPVGPVETVTDGSNNVTLTIGGTPSIDTTEQSPDLTNRTTTLSQQMPLQHTTQIPMEAKSKNNTATGGGFSFSGNFTGLTQDIVTAGSPAPSPVLHDKFGLDKTQSINLENGTTYPIKYKITDGQVTGMSLERTSDGRHSLIIDIVSEATEAENGRLLLEIPNVVLDPNRKLFVFEEFSPSKWYAQPEWKELARDPQSVVLETAFFVSVLPGPTTIHIAYR